MISKANSDIARIALWAISAAVLQLPWVETALLLAIIVLVPKTTLLAQDPKIAPQDPVLATTVSWSFLPAIGVVVSFAFSQGITALALCIPWLILTLVWALCGLRRLFSRTRWTPHILSDIAFLYIVVGASWLILSRAGAHPLDFSSEIVLLTAVHFHYAAFIVPIVVAHIAPRNLYGWLVSTLVVVGVPLTALGITLGGVMNLVGASTMALGAIGAASLLVRAGVKSLSRVQTLLFLVAALSLATAMIFAFLYALGLYRGWDALSITTMARWHGSFNALGFGVFSVWGLSQATTFDNTAKVLSPRSIILWFKKPTKEQLREIAKNEHNRSISYSPSNVTRDGVVPEDFMSKSWTMSVGQGRNDFNNACEAMRKWKGYDAARIIREPAEPDLQLNNTLILAIPALGLFHVTAMCEILEVVDEENRFGFAYGTLDHHPECGEERFIIELHEDESVTFTVDAIYKHGAMGIKVVTPLATYLQAKAITKYLEGIENYVAERRSS